MKRKQWHRWVLAAVILLAAALRFWNLGRVPQPLNADEAAIGYNAYSVLKTGKDEYNRPFPLAFRSFDDYKTPVYVYLTVPSLAVFGLTPFAVRLPSAITGILAVIAVYFLVRELLRYFDPDGKFRPGLRDWLPETSAFLLAVSPWHLQFSRSAYEASTALTFIIIGAWLFFLGLRKRLMLPVSAACFVLAMWSYHTPRIFVPLLLVVLAILFRKELLRYKAAVLVACIIGIVGIIPIIRLSTGREVRMRAEGVSSLADPGILSRSAAWQTTDRNSRIPLAGLIHNRRFSYAEIVLDGYFAHFDPAFFFLEKVRGKYHAPGVGLMYLWELPLLLYGGYLLFRSSGRTKYVLAGWLLLAPVAASPTLQLPHPVRTIVFLPALQIVTGIGFLGLADRMLTAKAPWRHIAMLALAGIVSVSVLYYLHQYHIHLDVEYAEDWQFGRKEAALLSEKYRRDFDTVIVSPVLDEPYIFWLFYLRYDPAVYQKEGGTVSGGFAEERNAFSAYRFRSIKDYEPKPFERVLFVGTPSEVFKYARVLYTVKYPSGEPAFVLFTFAESSPAALLSPGKTR